LRQRQNADPSFDLGDGESYHEEYTDWLWTSTLQRQDYLSRCAVSIT
jgi:hypothetical protein